MSGFKAKFQEAEGSIRKKYNEQQLGGHGLGVKDRLRVARGENLRWQQARAQANPNEELGENYATGGAGVTHRLPPMAPGMSQSSSSSPASRPPPPARGAAPPPPSRGLDPPPATAYGGAPPLPPARSGAAAPPVPPGAKPRLPLRMNNEAGVDNPPPPYGVAATPATGKPVLPARSPSVASYGSSASPAPTGTSSHVEFSKFNQADKAQLFALLDEYFAGKGANVTPAY